MDAALVDRPAFRTSMALRLERCGVTLAFATFLIGAAVLIGYVVRSESIVQLSPRLPPMYPNAALGLLCGGAGVMAVHRRGPWRPVVVVCAAVTGAIGVVGLWLNIVEADRTWFERTFPLDFVDPTTAVGGRPVVETCLALILIGGALVSMTMRRAEIVAQVLGVAAATIGFSAVVGYVLGVDRTNLGDSFVYVGMALHTAIGIAFVGLSIVLVRPTVGFMTELLDGGRRGAITRRLTFAVAIAPFLLVLVGVLLSFVLPTDELSQSVFSVLQVAVLSAAVLAPAAIITRTDRELRDQLDAARRHDEHQYDLVDVMGAIAGEMIVAAPDLPGWEIGMRFRPATGRVSGDSLQVHHRNQPRPATLIVLIDIAGHDAYSAVVAYGLRAHIAALWEAGADLADVVSSSNAKLVRRGTIATGVLVSFEHGTDKLHVVNAGHPPPLQLRAGDTTAWSRTGPLLGIEPADHDVRVIDVQLGDLIVLYTDGLIEARSGRNQQLGEDMVRRIIGARQFEPTQVIADSCLDAAIEHADSRLVDDVLIVVARRVAAR